jgi:ribonuclease P/MRP protein subunit RPP40
MISKGKKAIDDMFTIENGTISWPRWINSSLTNFAGTLTMYLGKETYERAGLVGKPYGAKGDRKLRPRWGMFDSTLIKAFDLI